MMNNSMKNAKVVRRYLEYLRDALRRSEATITAIERALRAFETATNGADFARFDRHMAKKFTSWLEEAGPSGKPTGARQSYQLLNQLRAFFHWLAFQPGYKSAIRLDDIDYLSLDKRKLQEVLVPNLVPWPTIEQVITLAKSIVLTSDVDRRDQALIAFLLLSAMRDMAVATLPLGCFDPKTLEVQQYPEKGVATKFSKKMTTHLFVFDDTLLSYVLEWVKYLRERRMFSDTDPLFPRTKVVLSQESNEFQSCDIEPVFWRSAGPIRAILSVRLANAGLPYFKPHSFRTAAAQLATRQCTSPEELRVVSQNLGHENVGTTLTAYAKLDPERVRDVLHTMDFRSSGKQVFDEEFLRKVKMLASMGNKRLDDPS